MILLARYINRPRGERLAQAGINFVDQSGNLHLRLGQHYHTLVLGNPDKRPEPEHRRLGAATVQTLFAFLADASSVALPAPRLAALAGVGKSAASEVRQRLAAEGVLDEDGAQDVRIADRKRLETLFGAYLIGRDLTPICSAEEKLLGERSYRSITRSRKSEPPFFRRSLESEIDEPKHSMAIGLIEAFALGFDSP